MIWRRDGKTNTESTEVFQVRVAEEGRTGLVLTGISEIEPIGSYVKAEKEGDFEISALGFWLPFVELGTYARNCARYLI